ncbi:MAG: type II toxin-antitoxin system RelE/ParE family toxin [Bacteroidota bacterium]
MAKEIVWSPKARASFDKVISYLQQKWTEREVRNFVKKSHHLLFLISRDKIKFRKSERKNIYEVPVTKHNLLLYRIKDSNIEILLFFDTRQHPKKKKVK